MPKIFFNVHVQNFFHRSDRADALEFLRKNKVKADLVVGADLLDFSRGSVCRKINRDSLAVNANRLVF